MKIFENRLVLLFFLVVLILIVVYLVYNQKLSKEVLNLSNLKKRIVEGFDGTGPVELLTNGNFADGKNVDQFSADNGINVIKQINNPGSSNYVLMQKQSNYNTFYKIMVTPEKNQTYLLTFWVRF